MSPHLRYNEILESGKLLLVESEILGCGIRYSTQGIRNPASLAIGIRNSNTTDKNPDPEFQERLG